MKNVKATVSGVTTSFIGTHFEWTGNTSTMVKYYAVCPERRRRAGTQRIAMRTGGSANPNLKLVLSLSKYGSWATISVRLLSPPITTPPTP